MRWTTLLLGIALLTSSGVAHAQEAPLPAAPPPVASARTSLPWLVTGGISLGLGVANIATAPLCELHAIRASARSSCVAMSLAFGGAFLAAGIPLLVVGVGRRREVGQVGVAPTVGGALATWRTEF